MEQSHIEQMVSDISKRSDSTVMWITFSFALGGATMEMVACAMSTIFKTSIPGLWGMWIPLCFITIPPIHLLCRQMKAMQKRIDELEKLSNHGVGA